MTDEQFAELIRALSATTNWWELILPSLLSLAAGAGITLLIAWADHQRERRRTEMAERVAVTVKAAAWSYRLAIAPEQVAGETLVAWTADSGALLAQFSGVDRSDYVTGWYLRRMQRLIAALGAGEDFNVRSQIGYSVQFRLRSWAEGNEPADRFLPAHDAQWEAEFAAATAKNQ